MKINLMMQKRCTPFVVRKIKPLEKAVKQAVKWRSCDLNRTTNFLWLNATESSVCMCI